ncbi:PAS domain S-box protein [Carboxylicivirga marina]|uniref:PAS domain S-box protein n=1 Tax=Carboxylicivirga marina TaxID=2800988 RepID=UPI0025934333|nr:PAS domain S-box protein [uncultured Carboxylicivirga sp.]
MNDLSLVNFSNELNAIFENAMVALILVNDEGKVVNINRTGLEFTGKKKDEVLNRLGGEVFNCINTWQDGKVVCGSGTNCNNCSIHSRVQKTFETGETHYKEEDVLYISDNDHSKRLDLHISTSLITIKEKRYTLLTIDDITKQKHAELALKKSQDQYQMITDNLDDLIWSFDMNEQCIYASPSVFKLRGIQVEEALSLNLEQAVGTDNYLHVKQALDTKLQQIKKNDIQSWEPFKLVLKYNKAGEDYWMQSNCRIIKSKDGAPQMFTGTSRDITHQVLAEEALRQSQQQYKFLVDNISDTVWTYDLNLKCTYISPSVYNLRGYTVEEAIELSVEETFHPDHLGKAYSVLNEKLTQIKQGDPIGWEPFIEEFKILRKDKSFIWAQLSVAFIKGENGEPIMIMGSTRDITKQKEIELTLQESQKHYKLINDHISDVVWTSDLNLNITHVSPSIYNLTGYTVEETLQSNPFDAYHAGDEVKLIYALIKQKIKEIKDGNPDGLKPFTVDIKTLRKDKHYIWTQETVSVIKGPDGHPHSIMGTSRDITQQKETTLALEQSEQKFKDTFKYSGVGMVLASLEGTFLNVNEAACRILGYPEDELLCKNFKEITHPEDIDSNLDLYNQLLNNEIKFYHLEKRYITKTGNTIWANLYVTAVRGRDNQALYLNTQIVDITPRITYQQQLLAEKKNIEAKESHYRALFEESFDAVILRKDRKAIACNQAAVDLLEYESKEELLNHRPEDVSPKYQPDGERSKDKALHHTQLAFKMGRWSFDWLFKTKTGKEKWANVAITRFLVNGEEYTYSIWRDISIRKKQELKLKSLSTKLAKAQSLASIGYFEFYIGDKYAKGSDEYYNIFQISRPEHTRQDFLDTVCPEDRERVLAIQGKAQKGDGLYEMKYRIKTLTGDYKYIHEIGEFKFDKNGTAISLLGMVHDITKEHESLLKLKSVSNKLTKAQQIGQVGNFEWYRDTDKVSGSDEYFKIFRSNPEAHNSFNDFIGTVHMDDHEKVQKALDFAIKNKEYYDVEYRLVFPDKEIKHIHAIGEFEFDKEGNAIYLLGLVHDITQRKTQELKLQSLSTKLMKAQSLASIGYFECNLSEDKSIGSDEYYKIYELKRTHHTAKDFYRFVCKEDLERVKSSINDAMNNKGVYDIKYSITTPSNKKKHIHEIGEFKYDKNEMPISLLGMVHDITKEREAELKLLESENKLKTIFDTSQVGITLNKERIIKFANPYICRLLNCKNEEVINTDSIHFYPTTSEYELVGQNINKYLKTNREYSQESRLKTKEGQILDVRINSSYYNGEDDSDGIISVITDITKLKHTETALKQSEQRYKSLFDKSGDPVLLIEDGNIIDCNQATLNTLKIKSKKELENIKIFELSPEYQPDGTLSVDKGPKMIQAAMDNSYHEFDWVHMDSVGQNIWFNIHLTKINLDNKEVIYTRWHDISERKQAESELKKSIDARNKFISVLGHDLRGAVGGSIPLIDLLEVNDKQWERRDEITDLIFKNINHSFNLLNSLITWGKTTLLNDSVQLSTINVFSLLEEVKALCQSRLQLKNISIVNLCSDQIMISADKNMIEAALRNLMTNAIKYSHQGASIYCNCLQKENEFEISISDEGMGMPEEQIKELFELNNIISCKGTAGEEGSGLGLQITKEYVEKHRGKIWAESELSKGTTIKFTIPVQQ